MTFLEDDFEGLLISSAHKQCLAHVSIKTNMRFYDANKKNKFMILGRSYMIIKDGFVCNHKPSDPFPVSLSR